MAQTNDHTAQADQSAQPCLEASGYASELILDPEVGIFCNPALNVRVRASEMTLGDYLDLRGWSKMDPSIDLQKKGYLIERPDMGPPNHESFPFFIAWLSKFQFDSFYRKEDVNNFSQLTLIHRNKDNG